MNTCHACGKTMQKNETFVQTTIGGQTRFFCCPMCLSAFKAGLVQRKMMQQDYADDRAALLVGYLPGLQVSGDYTCIRAVGDHKLYVVVAELSGSAAASIPIMSEISAYMSRFIEAGRDVSVIAQRLNDHLFSIREKDACLTLFAAELNFSRHILTYVSCGRTAHLLWTPRDQQFIRCSDSHPIPVGKYAPRRPIIPPVVEAAIYPSDQLIFFSDGALNQEIQAGRPVGESGLIALFHEMTRNTPERTKRSTFERIQATRRNSPSDDLLCVFMQIKKATPGLGENSNTRQIDSTISITGDALQ